MNNEDEETLPNIQLPNDEDAPTEKILPLPPIIMPAPPPIVRNAPVESDRNLVDSKLDRGRAGVASLALACLIAGALFGFFVSSLTAARELGNIPPEIQISTQMATTTATATATKTRTRTVEVTQPPEPAETVTHEILVPGKSKTVEVPTASQNCLNALDAADQYITISNRGSGENSEKFDALLDEARANYRVWRNECRKD